VADVIDGQDAEVGQAHGRGQRGAGEVQRLEALFAGLQRGQAIVGTGQGEQAATREQCAEAFAGGLCGSGPGQPVHEGSAVT
jgi:hypothetical protein